MSVRPEREIYVRRGPEELLFKSANPCVPLTHVHRSLPAPHKPVSARATPVEPVDQTEGPELMAAAFQANSALAKLHSVVTDTDASSESLKHVHAIVDGMATRLADIKAHGRNARA